MEEADVSLQRLEVQEEQVTVTSFEPESQVKKEEQQLIQPPEEPSDQTPDPLLSTSTVPEHEEPSDQTPDPLLSTSTAPEHEEPSDQTPDPLLSTSTAPEHEETEHPSAEPQALNQEKSQETSSSTPGNQHEDRPNEDPQTTDQQHSGTGEVQEEQVTVTSSEPESQVKKEEQQLIQPPEEPSDQTPDPLLSTSTAPEHEEPSDQTPDPLLSTSTVPEHEETEHPSAELQALNQEKSRGSTFMLLGLLGLLLAVIVSSLFSQSPPEHVEVPRVDIFLKEMERTKAQFPSQRLELWRRSRIHLERHLLTAQPTEPVSLILTAGRRAEKTLHCLAQHLASAFSSALNGSILHIDGASKAGQDSNQVKLDIDDQLRGAFGGDKPVAVIHRFEELPPSSTIIFYRYCDHENAAYKQASLIFTVLLAREDEVPTHLGLSAVEEMVDDHLQAKFLSSGHPAAFDRMDLDKFSGLWSRISHLILPVAAEDRIEQQGCGGTSIT